MDLKTFVSESLSQILDGVRQAQAGPDGSHVAASGYFSPTQGNLMPGGTSGNFTLVDFDVSVFAESKEGGERVRVASIESADASGRTSQNSSRVKFSVQIRLPDGGNFQR